MKRQDRPNMLRDLVLPAVIGGVSLMALLSLGNLRGPWPDDNLLAAVTRMLLAVAICNLALYVPERYATMHGQAAVAALTTLLLSVNVASIFLLRMGEDVPVSMLELDCALFGADITAVTMEVQHALGAAKWPTWDGTWLAAHRRVALRAGASPSARNEITFDDVRYMQDEVWSGDTFDNLRGVFSSVYANDGKRTYKDVVKAVFAEVDTNIDTMIDLLVETERQVDRFVLDLLLPLSEHLGDWTTGRRAIGALLDDLEFSSHALTRIVYGYDVQEPPTKDCDRDEIFQRVLAYRAVQSMVAGTDVHERIEAVVRATKANLTSLFASEDIDDCYLALCHTVRGDIAIESSYWCEPLYIVAEAGRAVGREDIVVAAIDEVIDHLAAIDTEHDEVRRNIERDLLELRDAGSAEVG